MQEHRCIRTGKPLMKLAENNGIDIREAFFLAAIACVGLIVVLSTLPAVARPHTGSPGVVEHFIAYAGTGFLFAVGRPAGRKRMMALLALAALSLMMEALQNFVPGRSPALFDAGASSMGAATGLAVFQSLRALKSRLTKPLF
jgi:hypothetical protein